jgi:hypothetical protein
VLGLLPANVQLILSLIFYAVLVIGAGWFLLIGSRKRAPSERREAFRKPARVRALGYLLLAGDALFVLTRPDSEPDWAAALAFGWLVLGFLVTWIGHRGYSRAANAYPPGKHAGPVSQADSRWPRWR